MTLFEIAEQYNNWIRVTDKKANDLEFDTTKEIELYKKQHTKDALIALFSTYQKKYDSNTLTITEIAQLAKTIVNSQHYCDGNHRTALLLCYHISLFSNDQALNIQPYLLYAAIDYEYLKSMVLEQARETFFLGNAIETALKSRSIKPVSDSIKNVKMEQVQLAVQLMPHLIERMAGTITNIPSTLTAQKKMFCQYLGFRATMEHSSKVSFISYKNQLLRKGLLDMEFDPTMDLNKCRQDMGDTQSMQYQCRFWGEGYSENNKSNTEINSSVDLELSKSSAVPL